MAGPQAAIMARLIGGAAGAGNSIFDRLLTMDQKKRQGQAQAVATRFSPFTGIGPLKFEKPESFIKTHDKGFQKGFQQGGKMFPMPGMGGGSGGGGGLGG